jgi:hypothetical protein
VNAVGGLLVSFLPALLRREYDLHLDVGIMLWLTLTIVLHVIGTLGPYQSVWWWDLLTHSLAGLIVAGIGYAIFVTIDRYSDAASFPDAVRPVFLFLFVVAIGVFWEVLEFGMTLASSVYGGQSVLIVFGVDDIVTDLIFTAVGGIVTAVWIRWRFRPLAGQFAKLLPG